MHIYVPLEGLLVILFFLLSTLFIFICTCNAESIRQTFLYLKSMVIKIDAKRSKSPAPSTIYAYVPRASYKRNWTPTYDDESAVCTRHFVPIWLQSTKTMDELYSSTYSFKDLHQCSVDSNINCMTGESNDTVCYVSSV